MDNDNVQRKLAAIFYADVVGYSKLMRDDEISTVRTLTEYREVFSSLIHQHRGRIIDSAGDSILAEFSSVVDAIQSAVSIQKEIKNRNGVLDENRRMLFRIGINIGDVIQEGDRIYGDGVNLAARLEGLAHPGGICISRVAYDQIESKLPLGYEYMGEQTVKNINKPIYAYHVIVDPDETEFVEKEFHPGKADSHDYYQHFDLKKEKVKQSLGKFKRGFKEFIEDSKHDKKFGETSRDSKDRSNSYGGHDSDATEQGNSLFNELLGVKHFRVFIGITLFLILINIFTSFGDWWFQYPLASIGLIIYFHWLKTSLYSPERVRQISEGMLQRELSELDSDLQKGGKGEVVAQKRVKKRIRVYKHFHIYIGVNSFLLLIDLFGGLSGWWFHYPLIFWGFALFLQWMKLK